MTLVPSIRVKKQTKDLRRRRRWMIKASRCFARRAKGKYAGSVAKGGRRAHSRKEARKKKKNARWPRNKHASRRAHIVSLSPFRLRRRARKTTTQRARAGRASSILSIIFTSADARHWWQARACARRGRRHFHCICIHFFFLLEFNIKPGYAPLPPPAFKTALPPPRKKPAEERGNVLHPAPQPQCAVLASARERFSTGTLLKISVSTPSPAQTSLCGAI